MILGTTQYTYNFLLKDNSIVTHGTLRILSVTLDNKLSFTPHVYELLEKVYLMRALSPLKNIIPKHEE